MEYKPNQIVALFLATAILLTGCAPATNPPTGGELAGAALGGVALGGTAAYLGASRPVIGILGLGGAGLGYYMASLRFASGGVLKTGGKVYTLGDYVIIEIPTDNLFDANTDEFLPGSGSLLNSIASVLNRYPNSNIIISGNTSGFGTPKREQKLSELRASQIASSLWSNGISSGEAKFKGAQYDESARRLIYVGYGDALPVANNIRLQGIRANSRIQIIASPSQEELHWDKCNGRFRPFENIGSVKPETQKPASTSDYANAFFDDHTPDANDATEKRYYNSGLKDGFSDSP